MARGAPEMRNRDPKEVEAIRAELAKKRKEAEEAAFPELKASDLKEVKEVVEKTPEQIRLQAEIEKQHMLMGEAVNADQLEEARKRLDEIMAEMEAQGSDSKAA